MTLNHVIQVRALIPQQEVSKNGALKFMYFVYLIECKDKSIYTGITTDVARRFKEHKSGVGGRYTRAKQVTKVLYTEKYKTRSRALKREAEIKSWRREMKLALIK